ncbi:MAG: DUF551 domain-containing protein [Caulobacteraceae bacterium]|nr:DUF551 domain-containing protein [Caulobacteraceae bacterium]
MEWMPIETAPRDGIVALVYGGVVQSICSGSNGWHRNDEVFMAKKYAGDDYYTVNDYFYVKPTHWMPLPNPPTQQGEK